MTEVIVTDEQVQAFMDLFRGYANRFGRFVITGRDEERGKTKGVAKTEDRPPNREDFRRHLEGKERLGIIPLREDNTVSFSALDIDKYNDSLRIEDFSKRVRQLPLICTSSKSGGIHAWMFTNPPLPAADIIRVMKHWAGELGHSKCEIFPKQSGRAHKEDIGNWINLPYFGDTCKAVVWNTEGTECQTLALEEFLHVAKNANPDLDYITGGALKVTAREKGASPIDFADGPPCMGAIMRKHAEGDIDLTGMRNMFLFNVFTYLKRKHEGTKAKAILTSINAGTYTLTIDHSKSKEKRDNETIGVPAFGLDDRELNTTLMRKTDKEYGYQCSQFPLSEYCQKAVCKKRKYGVGSDQRADMEITVENFVKYNTDPPKYFLDVEGKRVIIATSDDMLNLQKFRARVLDATAKLFPDMTKKQWEEFLKIHLETISIIEPPFEGSEVIDAVMNFIAEMKARTKEDMMNDGRCYYNDELRAYEFMPDAFEKYSKKGNLITKYDKMRVREELEREVDMKVGDNVQRRVGTKVVKVWRVPYDAIEKMTRPERDIEEESPF